MNRTYAFFALTVVGLTGCDLFHNPPPERIHEGRPAFPRQPSTTLAAPAVQFEEPATAPPPISGGSVYSTKNGEFIAIGDSDRDRVWIVSASEFAVRHEIALEPGDEPGRIAEDSSGTIHVVLRRSGNVVSINPQTGAILTRRAVCAAPRGIAFDPAAAALRVVCVGGEFVTLPVDGTAVTTRMLEPDLRDVVVREQDIVVSTFRGARVLFFNRELQSTGVVDLPNTMGLPERINTLWRMILRSDNTLLVTAQSSSSETLAAQPGGYGSGGFDRELPCTGRVNTVVLQLRAPNSIVSLMHISNLVPVPVDVVDDGNVPWIVSAANRGDVASQGFDGFSQVAWFRGGTCAPQRASISAGHTVTGGARVGDKMVFFSRQPAGLLRSDGRELWFQGASNVEHTGHRLFHGSFNNGTGLACASCHAEGGDDGLAWNFEHGSFRTPSLRGTIAGTAPYHWTGEFQGMGQLAADVFSSRMSGPALSDAHSQRLQGWIESMPALPVARPEVATQQAAVARGEAVFRGAGGCVSCHSGEKLTNNQTLDVGTGGAFQVPSLVGLRFRAPYMHDGCAPSIDARLSDMACGGANHGGYGLDLGQKSDLAAYLRSL